MRTKIAAIAIAWLMLIPLAVAEAEKEVASVQARLDEVRRPHHHRLPYGLGNPEVAKIETELAAAKTKETEARKALADFEEEARRAGIPPGWTSER